MLNSLRLGVTSRDALAMFKKLSRPLPVLHGILPTELFPLRNEVCAANKMRLDKLETELLTYESRDTGQETEELREKILKHMVAEKTLRIKANAQVMLVKNVDESLVNGSVGRVLGFYAASDVCGSDGEITPKSGNGFVRRVLLEEDGKTPVEKEVSERGSEGSGAKPRLKSESGGSSEVFPLVEFRTPSGKEAVLVGRSEFKVEDNDGTVVAKRVQVICISVRELGVSDRGSRSRWFSLGQCQYTRAKVRRSST